MRDIKFRAWDEQKKVMHYNFEFIRSGIEGNDWIVFKSDKQPLEKGEVLDNPYFAQQLKIMQFTGLKDKNGKEIYEGDIVKYYTGGTTETIEGIEKTFELIEIKPMEIISGSGEYDDWFGFGYQINQNPNDCEVIGNIYENPELLKGK